MKSWVVVTTLCIFFLAGCYVKTSFETDTSHVPASFSAPVLVITVQDSLGLRRALLTELELDVSDALSARGIKSITLYEAVGETYSEDVVERLRSKDYRALLKIEINQWGSKRELLQDPVPTSVVDSDSGPDSGSSFRSPTAIDYGESVPGPESSYKQVAMVGSLTDLLTSRLIWSGTFEAKPAVVGRSFIYHKFNREIRYEELAQRCFKRLAKELDNILPRDTES